MLVWSHLVVNLMIIDAAWRQLDSGVTQGTQQLILERATEISHCKLTLVANLVVLITFGYTRVDESLTSGRPRPRI